MQSKITEPGEWTSPMTSPNEPPIPDDADNISSGVQRGLDSSVTSMSLCEISRYLESIDHTLKNMLDIMRDFHEPQAGSPLNRR
jgi:hypothetical protein